MNRLPGEAFFSDAMRDSSRFHAVLQALEEANAFIRELEGSARHVDRILEKLLPKIAVALNAEQAFAAVVRSAPDGHRWFEITVAYPRVELRGQSIRWCTWLEEVVQTGRPFARVPLDMEAAGPVEELNPVRTVSAIVVRMQGLAETRIVGIGGSSDPQAEPFLAEDQKALNALVELVAAGVRAGEQRSRELESIQDSLAALSAELQQDRVFSLIVEQAVTLFEGAPVSLMLWDSAAERNLRIVNQHGLSSEYVEQVCIPRDTVEPYRRPDGAFLPLVFNLAEAPLASPELVREEGLHWALSSPLQVAARLIGVLNVYSKEPTRIFTRAEVALAQIFAHQAAIAVNNARLYGDSRKQTQHWQALHKASLVIAEGAALERRLLMQRIAEQAVESITGVNPPKARLGVIRLLDREHNELSLECAYPTNRWGDLLLRVGESLSLDPVLAPGGRIGIGGRCVRERRPQLVPDVMVDHDYVAFDAATRSELAVPILDDDEAIGVLSVESNEPAAFDDNDMAVLEGLAAMAVVAHRNSRLAEQLALNSAIASMGAWGAEMTHEVGRPLQHLQMRVGSLLDRGDLPPGIREELLAIRRDAEEMVALDLDWQRADESRRSCSLRELVEAEVTNAKSGHPQIEWKVNLKDDVTIGIELHWAKRLLGHLLNNAIDHGLSGVSQPRIEVHTAVEQDMAHIRVINNGPPVPARELPMLFRVPIPDKSGRHGRGLVVVRFVAEKCGGGAGLLYSDESGTCFEFYIPLVQGDRETPA